MLAVVEIFTAFALYWWLATHFDRSWVIFVGLAAAPMLLLRSPDSIKMGVEMLGRYSRKTEGSLSSGEIASIVLISALVAVILVNGPFTYQLSNYSGVDLLLRAAILGLVPFLVAISVSFSAASLDVAAIVAIAVVLTMVEGVVAGVVVYASASAFAYTFMGSGTSIGTSMGTRRAMLACQIFALGILLRGMFIRWVATFRHLSSGLSHLPQNWLETLLVIDLLHPPELLPQAGRIHARYTVKGILAMESEWVGNGLFLTILLLTLYLPALAYRLSLKASAWLWWPLALAISPPLEGVDDRASREKTAHSVSGAWYWLVVFTALVTLLPFLSPWPEFDSLQDKWLREYLSDELLKFAKALIESLSPNIYGVRHIALGVFCLLALYFVVVTKNLKASHGKVLESPKEFNDLTDIDRKRFIQLARRVEKFRMLLIVTMLVMGEAYAVSFFYSADPQLAEKILWSWLLRVI